MTSGAATRQEMERLTRDGFFTRTDFFSSEEIDRIERVCDRAVAYHNSYPPHLQDLYKNISVRDGITFVNEFGDDSEDAPLLKAFALQPRIIDLARSVAGPLAAHHCYQVVYKHPRYEHPFPWHQDISHTPCEPRFYNVWMAISDMTVANGCLWMLPSVGLDRVLDYVETPHGYTCWPLEGGDQGMPIELKRGSIVVNTSWTLHKSGPNTTDGFRKAILVAFVDERATMRGRPVRMTRYSELAA
jgi:ectoine hydroxylase-related dioxygenase (phytanoyl-CoA dioxygenase family)